METPKKKPKELFEFKKFLLFQKRIYKVPKTNNKYALKKFLVSCDAFVIFTAVKHKEIFSGSSLEKLSQEIPWPILILYNLK